MNASDECPEGTDVFADAQAASEAHEVDGWLGEVQQAQELFDATLSRLRTPDLRNASLLPQWTRAHVVAHVAYNARALTRLVDWAATGTPNPMYASRAARDAEIAAGARLTATQLRRLSVGEAQGFQVAWSALPEPRWGHQVRDGRGLPLAVKQVLLLRSRELWMHLIDLDAGITTDDVPAALQRRILQEVLDTWAARDHFVSATSTDDGVSSYPWASQHCGPGVRDTDLRISGELSDLLAWSTGRSATGIVAADFQGRPLETVPAAKPWL